MTDSNKTTSGGLVAIPAQETARFSMFAASLGETDLPEGWEIYFRFGHAIGDNINACIEEMIRRDKEWIWLLGDDHAWSPGLLNRLLDHCAPYASYDSNYEHVEHVERKIIVPLCLMRNPPYRPVIWNEKPREQSGDCFDGRLTTPAMLRDDSRYKRVELNDHPEGGVIEVAAAGGAGMLIHRSVIDAIGSGWFDAGRGTTTMVGEDINWCEKAREHGFSIYCDLDSMLGHCATTVVWPVREADGWTFGFAMMGGFKVTMPPGFQAYADECA